MDEEEGLIQFFPLIVAHSKEISHFIKPPKRTTTSINSLCNVYGAITALNVKLS